jgi:hypothetical protein
VVVVVETLRGRGGGGVDGKGGRLVMVETLGRGCCSRVPVGGGGGGGVGGTDDPSDKDASLLTFSPTICDNDLPPDMIDYTTLLHTRLLVAVIRIMSRSSSAPKVEKKKKVTIATAVSQELDDDLSMIDLEAPAAASASAGEAKKKKENDDDDDDDIKDELPETKDEPDEKEEEWGCGCESVPMSPIDAQLKANAKWLWFENLSPRYFRVASEKRKQTDGAAPAYDESESVPKTDKKGGGGSDDDDGLAKARDAPSGDFYSLEYHFPGGVGPEGKVVPAKVIRQLRPLLPFAMLWYMNTAYGNFIGDPANTGKDPRYLKKVDKATFSLGLQLNSPDPEFKDPATGCSFIVARFFRWMKEVELAIIRQLIAKDDTNIQKRLAFAKLMDTKNQEAVRTGELKQLNKQVAAAKKKSEREKLKAEIAKVEKEVFKADMTRVVQFFRRTWVTAKVKPRKDDGIKTIAFDRPVWRKIAVNEVVEKGLPKFEDEDSLEATMTRLQQPYAYNPPAIHNFTGLPSTTPFQVLKINYGTLMATQLDMTMFVTSPSNTLGLKFVFRTLMPYGPGTASGGRSSGPAEVPDELAQITMEGAESCESEVSLDPDRVIKMQIAAVKDAAEMDAKRYTDYVKWKRADPWVNVRAKLEGRPLSISTPVFVAPVLPPPSTSKKTAPPPPPPPMRSGGGGGGEEKRERTLSSLGLSSGVQEGASDDGGGGGYMSQPIVPRHADPGRSARGKRKIENTDDDDNKRDGQDEDDGVVVPSPPPPATKRGRGRRTRAQSDEEGSD